MAGESGGRAMGELVRADCARTMCEPISLWCAT